MKKCASKRIGCAAVVGMLILLYIVPFIFGDWRTKGILAEHKASRSVKGYSDIVKRGKDFWGHNVKMLDCYDSPEYRSFIYWSPGRNGNFDAMVTCETISEIAESPGMGDDIFVYYIFLNNKYSGCPMSYYENIYQPFLSPLKWVKLNVYDISHKYRAK